MTDHALHVAKCPSCVFLFFEQGFFFKKVSHVKAKYIQIAFFYMIKSDPSGNFNKIHVSMFFLSFHGLDHLLGQTLHGLGDQESSIPPRKDE